MNVVLVWSGILAIFLFTPALLMSVLRYHKYPARQSVAYVVIMALTAIWLMVYTFALFSDIYIGRLPDSWLRILGLLRAGISAAIALLIPICIETPSSERPVLRMIYFLFPATVYLILLVFWFGGMTPLRSAIISVFFYGILTAYAVSGLVGARGRYPRGVFNFLVLITVWYPLLAMTTLPPIYRLAPTVFSVLPRALFVGSWALMDILAFFHSRAVGGDISLPDDFSRAWDLTDRERDVLQEALTGGTYVQIAERLFISPKTVETHLRHIYRKAGVSNMRELLIRIRPDS